MFPKNKRIGVDIDETIAATFEAVLQYAKKNYPSIRHCQFDMLVHHDWWDVPEFKNIGKKEVMDFFREYDQYDSTHENILPINGSMQGVNLLKDKGYSLYAITGRNETYARDATLHWIHRHFPDIFSEVIFTNHNSDGAVRKNKSEICKEFGIELMIEDNIDFALELSGHNIASYVLIQPWNRHRIEQHKKIKRVTSWQEIINDIQKTHV